MSTQDYVTQIWLLVTTADKEYADTKAGLQLEVGLPGLDVLLETDPVSSSKQTLNSRGRSAQFTWTPGGKGTLNWTSASFTPAQIAGLELEIVGKDSGDAWLPSSVWVITKSAVSGYQVLSAYPTWPSTGWFSTNPKDGSDKAKPAYLLTPQLSGGAAGVLVEGLAVVGEPEPSGAA